MAILIRLAIFFQVSLVLVTAVEDPCHNGGKYECPKYTVTEKGNGFEVRKYGKTNWVESSSDNTGYKKGSSLFMRLFKYIQGANEDNVKIPMTVPVLSPKEFGDDGGFKLGQTMMFWLPSKFQEKPPVPTSEDVKIKMTPEQVVYVRSFSWWASNWMVKWHTGKLMASLKAAGLVAGTDFEDRIVVVATYNNPWQIFGRTNEVMLIKKTIPGSNL